MENAILTRMVGAEVAAIRARSEFETLQNKADNAEAWAVSREREAVAAREAYNGSIRMLAASALIAPAPSDLVLISYDPDTAIVDASADCDRCDKKKSAFTKTAGNFNDAAYCAACWEIVESALPGVYCEECFQLRDSLDADNRYIPSNLCGNCAGSPCHHCGIEGGH